MCNIAEEIEKKIISLSNLAKKKDLYLKTDIHDPSATIKTDPDLFGNALLHLVDNSIKFTNQGGVIVQVKTHKVNDQPRLIIKVTDTGIGIPDKEIENIFNEFRQASEGYSRHHEGMGVGLTIAKKIVELLDGEIWVESKPGIGSTFYISFPLSPSESQINKEIRDKKKSTSVKEPLQSGEKPLILVVEDNVMNREVVKLFLKNGFEINEAPDGITALALAANINFDLVLMDINLGKGIDGIKTMQKMREILNYAHKPIIAVTAYVLAYDSQKFIDLGFDGYIPKPFTKEMFLRTIKQKLNIKD
jgi:two-component system, sensor histidine kinase